MTASSRVTRSSRLSEERLTPAADPGSELGVGEVTPLPECGVGKGLLPQTADRLVDPLDLLVDRRGPGLTDTPLVVDLLVVMDDGRGRWVGGDPAQIVDRGVPSDIEWRRPDPLRGQGQGHRDLVEVEGPVEEQFAAVEQPAGPRLPGRGEYGQQGRRDQIQPAVAVADHRRLAFAPRKRRGRRDRHLGGREDVTEHGKRWHRGVDNLPPDRPRRQDERARIIEHRDVGVAEHHQALGLLLCHPQGTGHLVAVGGSRVERLDGPHRDPAGPQIEEGIRGVPAHDVDDQVPGIDTGEAGERREPAKCFQVEARMFVDDTGEDSRAGGGAELVRRAGRAGRPDGPLRRSSGTAPAPA